MVDTFLAALMLVLLQTSDWQMYTSVVDHFQLKYPPTMQVHASIISDYEKVFAFESGGSRLLTLRVVDWKKYLPKTNTPNLEEYLSTFERLPRYKAARIAGKPAHEYVLCGRAACDQDVVFLNDNRMYDFSVDVAGTGPDSVSFEKIPMEIQAIIRSIQFR